MSCAAPAQFFSLGAPSGPRRVLKACRRSFQNQLFQTPLHSWRISESFSWVLQARLSRWKREPIYPSQPAGKQPPSQVALRQQPCAGGARNRGCYCLPRQREGITPENSSAAGGIGKQASCSCACRAVPFPLNRDRPQVSTVFEAAGLSPGRSPGFRLAFAPRLYLSMRRAWL